MFTLDCDRAYLYAHPERELTDTDMLRYDDALARRASGVPAQYITGHQEFWGLDLIVTPAVLIPRPETEHVVEAVLELASAAGLKHSPKQTPGQSPEPRAGAPAPDGRTLHGHSPNHLRVVDVGTGSGAIALVLALALPTAEIHATDISADALEVARANAARHQLASRLTFQRGDLLDGFSPASFDFVVSNPPYVGESEEESVQLEVRKFEPRSAVFAGATGREIIQRLIPAAGEILRPGGWLVLEISGTIAEGVLGLLAGWDDVAIRNDLQGIARVAMARKATSD